LLKDAKAITLNIIIDIYAVTDAGGFPVNSAKAKFCHIPHPTKMPQTGAAQMSMVTMAVPALCSLSDVTKIEIILFVSHC
jgi:hypothetical protein